MHKDGRPISGMLYSLHAFAQKSFFNFLLSDIAVLQNSDAVTEFLQTNGFTNVSIKRMTSPHNGRKNVWIVRAIKK